MTTPTPISAHDHGNCELCDQIERDLAAAQEAIRYLVDHQGHFQTKHAPAIDAAMRKP